jgi:hypothetical protein
VALERRAFLKLASIVAGATLSACTPMYRILADSLGGPAEWIEADAISFRLLNRLTYGPTLQERGHAAAIGIPAWIEEQLVPAGIADGRADLVLRPLTSLTLQAADLAAWDKRDVIVELKRGTLLRRIYSRRQLLEIMVEFWSDHFNVSIEKGDCWYLKTVEDRDVIRRHALGNFRELLQASAHSPAMLVYLDNQANDQSAPNENYARELLELHTLGVDGGYSQRDVMELARCLTGWSVRDRFWRGQFVFREGMHDPGPKQVLGAAIRPGGEAEVSSVLDRLASHPATARRLARKMARRFLGSGEDLPEALVDRAAQAYLDSGYEITPMLRTILFDGLVRREAELVPRFKRPVDFVVSVLRMLDASTHAGEAVLAHLARMGHSLFEWPTPDGPPEEMAAWQGGLFARWDFAHDLARGRIDGTKIHREVWDRHGHAEDLGGELDALANLLLGAAVADPARSNLLHVIAEVEEGPELLLAGLVASPSFQWR